jgi:hypothetical protein
VGRALTDAHAAHLRATTQDLEVTVGGGKKVLLNKVSGAISLGFYAVMGKFTTRTARAHF